MLKLIGIRVLIPFQCSLTDRDRAKERQKERQIQRQAATQTQSQTKGQTERQKQSAAIEQFSNRESIAPPQAPALVLLLSAAGGPNRVHGPKDNGLRQPGDLYQLSVIQHQPVHRPLDPLLPGPALLNLSLYHAVTQPAAGGDDTYARQGYIFPK